MSNRPFSDEQRRLLANLAMQYDALRDVDRRFAELPYDLRRKVVNDREYLYEIDDRDGNGRSLGLFDEDHERRFAAYRAEKAELKDGRKTLRERLKETGRLYRSLGLPLLSSDAGAILREADRRGLLDADLLVVGTNAMPAYQVEAATFIDVPDETLDFDLAWVGDGKRSDGRPIMDMLKAVDPTFTVNSERTFQARNREAYEVEILIAPSRAATLMKKEGLRPVALPEQEWLLQGQPVDRIVVSRDNLPARVRVPDPRWFALHKIWLSSKPSRDNLKRAKDLRQGEMLLLAVRDEMPNYPIDNAFRSALPSALEPLLAKWEQENPVQQARSDERW